MFNKEIVIRIVTLHFTILEPCVIYLSIMTNKRSAFSIYVMVLEDRYLESSGYLNKMQYKSYFERVNIPYCRFQITFHCSIPNFVPKFGNSLRSSKVHFRIPKPVCKLSI